MLALLNYDVFLRFLRDDFSQRWRGRFLWRGRPAHALRYYEFLTRRRIIKYAANYD